MKKILILISLLAGCTPKPDPIEHHHWSAVELLRNQRKEELSEWQMLQLAIVYTESKFRPDVTGKNQDGGLYQITPIFVKEVNRIAGTDYTHEDVYDPDKAIEIFGKMQDAKNPGHDIDTAIYFHNKSANYRRVVLENLELIKRYETFRSKLIEKCSGE